MTDIMFRPSFTYSNNDGVNKSTSGSYNADPYSYVLDPLSTESIKKLSDDVFFTKQLIKKLLGNEIGKF